MSEVAAFSGLGNTMVWGSGAVRHRTAPDAAPRAPQARPVNAWLSAEEVAHLLLTGECLDARVRVPARFSPQAIASAVSSVERWTSEGRIFAIHELYPRYQFDDRGRPYAAIERALAVFGAEDPLQVGNWFAAPNPLLGGNRPQKLLATDPDRVQRALEEIARQESAGGVLAR
jgi:hypothetical protein